MDENKLDAFVGRAVSDMAVVESAAAAYLGDRLGLYATLAGAGPLTSAELAARTRTHERLVREWCHGQVAAGYVEHDPATGAFTLPPEHAAVLVDADSPVYLAGILEIAAAMWAGTERLATAFRDGGGVGWGEHDPRLYRGVERLFAPLYRHQLVPHWIPALDGVEDKLRAGARVADVGCGHGVSSVLLAAAYPASTVVGVDNHAASIDEARKAAVEAGVGDRTRFEVAGADALPGTGYDLVCFLDALHDMGDPLGAARRAREVLAPDGTVLVVEPRAGDALADNVGPVGRLFYAGSLFLCTPSAVAQGADDALGGQAGAARLGEVLREAGFGRVRTALETPFNLVLEARP